MKLIIDGAAGFALEDTDTGDAFQFAGNLSALNSALTAGVLTQAYVERTELAGGELILDKLTVTGS